MVHAQVIDFAEFAGARPDPRAGELQERLLMSIDAALSQMFPGELETVARIRAEAREHHGDRRPPDS